jgi:pyruvate formate-lyase activating enzyme-like uncharacterized protein
MKVQVAEHEETLKHKFHGHLLEFQTFQKVKNKELEELRQKLDEIRDHFEEDGAENSESES